MRGVVIVTVNLFGIMLLGAMMINAGFVNLLRNNYVSYI
jgi:hypothetical protein